MGRRSFAFVVASTIVVIACSSLDDLTSPNVDAADGGDASADAPTADRDGSDDASGDSSSNGACAPATSNLLAGQNEGFEDGCSLWTADRANLTASTVAACGMQACRVCPWYPGIGAAFLVPGVNVASGERYVFSIKIRREGDTAGIRARAQMGVTSTNDPSIGSIPLMTEWGTSTATVDVGAAGAGAELRIDVVTADSKNGECFLVDEAVLRRTKDAGP